MTLISDLAPQLVDSAPLTVTPTLIVGDGPIIALPQRPVVSLGSLSDRALAGGERVVAAFDPTGAAWWIPAEAVWSDAEDSGHPQHPRPVGLATARTTEQAMLSGLSDRLGWEAVAELRRGRQLPALEGLLESDADDLVLLDGRLDHDVPTVVIIGHDMVRWGAGATWSAALHRALYGDDGSIGDQDELAELAGVLDRQGLAIVAVDMATPVIRKAGVVRFSIQLLVPNDDSGRPWDAQPVE